MSADELWKKNDRCQHKHTLIMGTVIGTSTIYVHVEWDDGHEDLTHYQLLQDPVTEKKNHKWEPFYGFCATDKHSNVALAEALEYIRRKCRGYGPNAKNCDCKYGAKVGGSGSLEQTGCPELREVIYRLLHKHESFGENNV